MEYCLNCIEKLVIDHKKLGSLSVWLKCKKCGYRTRSKSEYIKNKEMDQFEDYKERINSNNIKL